MKKLLLLLPIFIFAFQVEFTKIYKTFVIPSDTTYEVCSSALYDFPFEVVKRGNCYILLDNFNDIDLYLTNQFYPSNNTTIKKIKYALIDYDTIQYDIIRTLKQTYKTCNIKSVIFLNDDVKKIITKPQTIKLKYKIILDCN